MSDIPAAAPVCDHFYAWVSPAGSRKSARLCQYCSQPDPVWLNNIYEITDETEVINIDESVPLTFTKVDTGEKITIGTAKFVTTPKGIMILATVGHNQFETLLDHTEISSFSINRKEKENGES